MLKRSAMILALALALLPMMQFVHYRGSRLVGFKYSRSVNNLATECPDTVAALDGRKITLADGRAFDVEDVSASAIAEELKYCNSRVRIADETLYTLRPIAYCGFDLPERCQWITIPIVRVDLRRFSSREFASVHSVAAPARLTLPVR